MTTGPVPFPHIDPNRTALLVMDYQNGIVGMVDNGDELVAITRNLIRTFRDHGGTVGYVRLAFADGDLDDVPATSGMARNVTSERREFMHVDHQATQIHESLTPEEGDIVVRKVRVGAFSTTDLHEQLQARGIDTLVLAGISTSGCVHSTVLDAYDRDYRVIVLSDACADPNNEVHRFLLEHVFTKRGEVMEVRDLHQLMH
jgi:nicotinamidase-related amidase